MLVPQVVLPDKLAMAWTGPHAVTNTVSPFAYECDPMISVGGLRSKIIVHIVRVRHFTDGLLGAPADRERIEREALTDFPRQLRQAVRRPPHRRGGTTTADSEMTRIRPHSRHRRSCSPVDRRRTTAVGGVPPTARQRGPGSEDPRALLRPIGRRYTHRRHNAESHDDENKNK